MGLACVLGEAVPSLGLLDRFENATGRPVQSECISQRDCGAVKVGGSRKRTSRVRESPDKRILGKNASFSHDTSPFGEPDATSSESFLLPSVSRLTDDAVACRPA